MESSSQNDPESRSRVRHARHQPFVSAPALAAILRWRNRLGRIPVTPTGAGKQIEAYWILKSDEPVSLKSVGVAAIPNRVPDTTKQAPRTRSFLHKPGVVQVSPTEPKSNEVPKIGIWSPSERSLLAFGNSSPSTPRSTHVVYVVSRAITFSNGGRWSRQ